MKAKDLFFNETKFGGRCEFYVCSKHNLKFYNNNDEEVPFEDLEIDLSVSNYELGKMIHYFSVIYPFIQYQIYSKADKNRFALAFPRYDEEGYCNGRFVCAEDEFSENVYRAFLDRYNGDWDENTTEDDVYLWLKEISNYHNISSIMLGFLVYYKANEMNKINASNKCT